MSIPITDKNTPSPTAEALNTDGLLTAANDAIADWEADCADPDLEHTGERPDLDSPECTVNAFTLRSFITSASQVQKERDEANALLSEALGGSRSIRGELADALGCGKTTDEILASAKSLRSRIKEVEAERDEALALLNSPELHDFSKGVVFEAGHQRKRWGASHDAGKAPLDWFWLIGYLAQKAADAAMRGDIDKAKHHTISTSAALANWHAALSGINTEMRPGIDLAERGVA